MSRLAVTASAIQGKVMPMPLAEPARPARKTLLIVDDHPILRLGLTVLIETSPATLAPTPGLAAALVDHQAPERAGILFDPGNTVIEGYVRPALALAVMGPHLHHVHVKNIAWRKVSDGWTWRHASLTAGVLVWPDILAALTRAGYQGGYSIDHLGGKPTRGRLRSETEGLRALLGGAAGTAGPARHDSTEKGAEPSLASA